MKSTKTLALIVVVIVALAAIGGFLLLKKDSGDKDTLTIGIANKNGYDPLIYAYEAGLFEDEGLEVNVKWDENGGLTTAALLAGQVDMTNAGTTPVINAIHKSSNIRMVACNCFDKFGQSSLIIVTLKSNADSLDLGDLKNTFFNADGTYNGTQLGMAYSSGYYSTWVQFVNWESAKEGLTATQVEVLTSLNGEGGAITDLNEASTGITNLLSANPSIDFVIGGSDIDVVSSYPDALTYLNLPAQYLTDNTPVGGVYIVSEKAYEEKKPAIEKALRAIKKAAAVIEDVSVNGADSVYFDKVAEYTMKYGAYTDADTMLKTIQKLHWGMFLLTDVFDYYNNAEAADPATHVEGFDLRDSFTDEFLKSIYGDEPYTYDRWADVWS